MQHRGAERTRLLERDVGWQRRHLWVGDDLQHGGPAGRQRAVPAVADRGRIFGADSGQTQHLGPARIGGVGKVLRGDELGVSRHRALLPGDLVEVAVVEHEHDQALVAPALAVLGDREQLSQPVHLHSAVAHEREHRAIGIRELGRDRVWHARAHRRQRARERAHHPVAQADVARIPVSRRARVRGDDGAVGQPLGELLKDELRVDRLSRGGGAPLEHAPPVAHAGGHLVGP